MIKNQLIYVAHPFGGDKANKYSIDTIMENLVMLDKNNTYLSKGLKICLDMLNRCDALVLCGEWETSKGCIGEWSFAIAKGMPIYTWKEWTDKLKEQGDNSR